MKVRNVADAKYLLSFGLRALSAPVLLQQLLARFWTPLLAARYLEADGTLSLRPLPLPNAALAAFRRLARRQQPVAVVGRTLEWEQKEAQVDLTCAEGWVRVELFAPGIVRIRLSHDGQFRPARSYAVVAEGAAPPFSFVESRDFVEFRTTELICRVELVGTRLLFTTPEREVIAHSGRGSMGWRGGNAWCSFEFERGDEPYGLGAKACGLSRRGQRYTLWNLDPEIFDEGDDPLYHSIPFFLVLKGQGQAYGIFLDSAGRTEFDFGQVEPDEYSFATGGPDLCYYFLWGPSPAQVLERYTMLTGRMPLPPLWALGYSQSRWGYSSQQELESVAAEFRRRAIPCDALYLDTDHMDRKRSFTWDSQRFPQPEEMLARLRQQGFRTVTIVDPGIRAARGYSPYEEGRKRNAFCRWPDGKLYKGPVWPGWCAFPDFTDSETRRWWGQLVASFVASGLSGIWCDMNEPTVFGARTLPDPIQHACDGLPAPHRACHNAYGMQMARAAYEALEQARPDERPFVLTRATFAGGQRYGAIWTGDNQSTWEHLRLSVPMCLSLAVSGFSFCGADVGGFARSCDGELLVRWLQLGAFLPFYRNHSALNTARQEPWAFGPSYEAVARKAISLRYQFLPYIYTAFYECSRRGLPIVRPLAFEWPLDERARKEQSEFLCGQDLLVAPVCAPGADTREVYLPEGVWFDFWSGERLQGPATFQAQAPLELAPLYVRAGTVLPCWPDGLENVEEGLEARLLLRVYAGHGRSLLYQDDGHSLAYRNGSYRLVSFRQELSERAWSLRTEWEGSYQPPQPEVELYLFGLPCQPKQLRSDGQEVLEWQWLEDEKAVSLLLPSLPSELSAEL